MLTDCIDIDRIIDCMFEKPELMTPRKWDEEVLCEGTIFFNSSVLFTSLKQWIDDGIIFTHDELCSMVGSIIKNSHRRHDFSEIPLLR